MSETLPPTTSAKDPSLIAGSTIASHELKIRFNTFEEAQTAEKKFSDPFIDNVINENLQVGNERVGVKGYLDKVEATENDNAIIADPEDIAGLYLRTTDMLARNLKILTVRNPDPIKDADRKAVIKNAKDEFINKLHDESGQVADAVVDWCSDYRKNRFPVDAMEYKGLIIDGMDPLNAEGKSSDDFRSNFKIQRQLGGTFIMGYSDQRVIEKIYKQDQELGKRIYLNPDALAVPAIFEQVLVAANQAGLSIQLKMLQRAPEFAEAHVKRSKGQIMDGFRGDGIVIYADEAQANDVLAMVLSIARDKPEAFRGRKTSKVPQNVTEGVAVGDEPTQMKGKSLTSHREMIVSYAAEYVRQSGKTGDAARDLFRRCLTATAKVNKIEPKNLAFNMAE